MSPSAGKKPDLDRCVETLESISRDAPTKASPKTIAELYLAAVGLLCHLKADQVTLRERRKEYKGQDTTIPCPPPEETPAMTAVINNQKLFWALLSCLSGSGEFDSEGGGGVAAAIAAAANAIRPLHHHPPGVGVGVGPLGRKRTHSISEPAPSESASSKCLKLAHSPNVSKRMFTFSSKPQFNVKALAGAILFAAFEYIDHWPTPMIKAYADDCFGTRSWVDEPSCQLLVKNLALTHTGKSFDNADCDALANEIDEVSQRAADALIVAEFFRMNAHIQSLEGHRSSQNSPVHDIRRESISSTASVPSFAVPPLTKSRSASMELDIPDEMASSETMAAATDVAKELDTPSKIAVSKGSSKDILPKKRQRTTTTPTTPPPQGEEDSDSGEDDEIKLVNSGSGELARTESHGDDGSSSSSGEEDEEVVATTKSFDENRLLQNSSPKKSSSNKSSSPANSNNGHSNWDATQLSYPVLQQRLNLERVRQRYFGVNLEYAHDAISASLSERLDVKSKQNSGLLQSLPSFTSVPSVRTLIAANLEKWLQSPALSGLARSLFSKTVQSMKHVDPPLPADLQAIDNILCMRLKANQLNAHIENVTAIACKIPTAAISHHIYTHLLGEVLLAIEAADTTASDHLKMIGAVHGALPNKLSSKGIAASLLSLLINPPSHVGVGNNQLVRKLGSLIRAISDELGASFDGCQLLQSLLEFDVTSEKWTATDEENRARLMYQCVTLLVHSSRRGAVASDADIEMLRNNLIRSRKLLLSWCCRVYAPLCRRSEKPANGQKKSKEEEIVGAGPADYNSILDGQGNSTVPPGLKVMRCLLFMEDSASPDLKKFLSPGGSSMELETFWQEESKRIDQCCEHGADLDDEMIWIVLRSTTPGAGDGMSSEVALALLEHLFEYCNGKRKSSLHLTDPQLMWGLYKVVEYIPPQQANTINSKKDIDRMADSVDDGKKDGRRRNGIHSDVADSQQDVPRLAYPGMWWRATGLAIVMCGASPDHIGAVAWEKHPTLRTLIKMVTSDRYRFPTVDSDDLARDEMKKTEQIMRDEESRVSELLFLPPNTKKKPRSAPSEPSYGGSRASKRQKDKRERLLVKLREMEAADALAEANRRKKVLRVAQKSIMLWDPRKGPRKPPRESADLIFSLNELFGLSKVFQRTVQPDFVLRTIGQTTRGAIERAYDWLIPIISYLPDTIGRLPASASCFLLLRAYGTEGEERAQLQELSAPLLLHVRNSLKGKFGEPDAVRAFDLLLTDVSSHNPDRRRCARRVLHDAIGREKLDADDSMTDQSNCTWMTNMLQVEHLDAIIGDAINYMSRAASFERGSTLCSLVLALEGHMDLARRKGIVGSWNFSLMLIDLLSSRPTVFAEAMDAFPDLRSRAIRVVRTEFDSYLSKASNRDAMELDSAVIIAVCQSHMAPEAADKVVEAKLPLALLQSACVLLSIWRDENAAKEIENVAELMQKDKNDDAALAVEELVRMLLRDDKIENVDEDEDADLVLGLASAKIAGSGKSAVPVESWVMLARARSDFIARRAALTAPTGFLPRLLLCSGLPRASLLTMIDRLGKLGDKAQDKRKTFNQLLVPSAASEWDIGRLGHRREVSRKLLGRLSAYSHMYQVSSLRGREKISSTFLEWLSDVCSNVDKPRKAKPKKQKISSASTLSSPGAASSILSALSKEVVVCSQRHLQLDGDASDMTRFLSLDFPEAIVPPRSIDGIDAIKKFIDQVYEKNQADVLETWLDETIVEEAPRRAKRTKLINSAERVDLVDLATYLLQSHLSLKERRERFASILLKWVPLLSRSRGSPELWQDIFSDESSFQASLSNALLSGCMQIWCESHISFCRTWILSLESFDALRMDHLVRFLVDTSAQHCVNFEGFAFVAEAHKHSDWCNSKESVATTALLALDCLQQASSDAMETALCSRNHPPDSLVLLLLVSSCGRKQIQRVSQAVVQRLEKADGDDRPVLLAVILRLYAAFPHFMNLGVAILRSVLKESVERYAHEWLEWRSPLDDQLQDMIDTIVRGGGPPRLVQALAEEAKKHPLLVLRKLEFMVHALDADGIVQEHSDNRGIIFGQSLNEPHLAKVGGRIVKLTVKHWGFNYTENLWLSLLDVVSAVPREVLFVCGLKMGLPDFLAVYLRLMFVQSQLRTSDKVSRLKSKLTEFFDAFQAANMEGWETWMSSKTHGLDSLGKNRNVLMSCNFISHQQAIDNVKKQGHSPSKRAVSS